jgi:hypothetical protein
VHVISQCGKSRKACPGNLIEALKSNLPYEKVVNIIYWKRPDEQIRKAINAYMSDRTIQDPGKIESNLKLIGVDDIWEPLRIRLRLSSKQKAKEYLVKYVKRRHQIVHEGDFYKSKRSRHKLRKITRPYASASVASIKRFVAAISDISANQLLRKYGI